MDSNSDSCSAESSAGPEPIKSTTAVRQSLEQSPVRFCELAQETNLNLPPENWLRGHFAEREPWIPRNSAQGNR